MYSLITNASDHPCFPSAFICDTFPDLKLDTKGGAGGGVQRRCNLCLACAGTGDLMESTLQAGRYVYFDDLGVLSQLSPSLRQPLPSMLCQVHTPLVIAEWRSQWCQYPDREFCQYLIDGLTDGFRIGFNYTSHRCQAAKCNMLSAVQNPGIVEQYLKKECELGCVVGPLVAGSIPLHINRFGVIPKPHQPGKWRLIVDLSHPAGHSVNDGTEPELCSLSYAYIDDY